MMAKLLIVLLISLFSLNAYSATVGVKESEPFVYQDNGKWAGVSVELWEFSNPGEHTYKEYNSVEELISAVASSEVDVGVAPASITAERETIVDFTHPYFKTGLSYAVKDDTSILYLMAKVFPKLIMGVSIIVLVMLFAGLIHRLIECYSNNEKLTWQGIFDSCYWASATTTTVGYGDVVARCTLGKVFSIVWMWLSVLGMGTLTALIVSAVNVESKALDQNFNLYKSDVAVISGSTGNEYMENINTDGKIIGYDSLQDAANALLNGEVDGIVHDRAILNYNFSEREEILVRDDLLTEESYAFIVKENSDMLEELNRSMLLFMQSNAWNRVIQQVE